MLAQKIVVPGVNGDLTVLRDRAPTLILLRNGILQVLDAANNPVERYYVKGGIADIARNRCAVSSEKVVDCENMTLEKATEKRDAAIHQEDKDFYQMIINDITVFGNK